MAYAPAAVIDAPVARVPLPFGLFSVVSVAEAATERWENGVEWEAFCPDPLNIVVGDCDAPEGFPKEFPTDGPGLGSASAFTVYGVYKCSPTGNGPEHPQERAREHLQAREEEAVESRLWATIDDAPTVLAGGDPVEVVGQLEQFIAETFGAVGVIHASRNAATTLAQKGLLVSDGRTMRTMLGTPVVAGSGYPGTGVAGAAPSAGTEFVVGTPGLFGYRSQIFEATGQPGDLLDRDVNDFYGIAERNYLIGHEPCGVAFAPLTLGCC